MAMYGICFCARALRMPTGTPSIDFALQGVSGDGQAQQSDVIPQEPASRKTSAAQPIPAPHFYFASGFGPKVAFVVGV